MSKFHELTQEFTDAVVARFKNIKVSEKVTERSHLKNELAVIMLPKPIFDLYAKFIVDYSQGNLVNPDSGVRFNEEDRWKAGSELQLHREFFKRLRGFNNRDFRALALHLLNRTPNREQPYPKVTVKKISSVRENTYSAKEWVDRRKDKRLIIGKLHEYDPSLDLIDEHGEVDRNKWK